MRAAAEDARADADARSTRALNAAKAEIASLREQVDTLAAENAALRVDAEGSAAEAVRLRETESELVQRCVEMEREVDVAM